MRKDQINASADCSSNSNRQVNSGTDAHESLVQDMDSDAESRRSASTLHFFVSNISGGNTLVIHANQEDNVLSLHKKIHAISGIPIIEQRLIYGGKQLQLENTLGECNIQKDSCLQLVGRMRSTEHPKAWQAIDIMFSSICRLCKNDARQQHKSEKDIKAQLCEFLKNIPRDIESAEGYFQIFMSASVPAALVMLYMSPYEGNKDLADNSIRLFLDSSPSLLPTKHIHARSAPIVLEFCKLLSRNAHDDDPLYLSCRSTLGSLLETIDFARGNIKPLIALQEITPFVDELAIKLSRDLASSMEASMSVGPLLSDVRDFTAFLLPLRNTIMVQGPISMPIQKDGYDHCPYEKEIELIHDRYTDLLSKMDQCLHSMEVFLESEGAGEGEIILLGWSQYLAILKELNDISKLYLGAEEQFWTILRLRRLSVSTLIIRYAKRTDDNRWLLKYKDVANFESRRHLMMMMSPEVKEDYKKLHEMPVDRSQSLASFLHILQTPYIRRSDI